MMCFRDVVGRRCDLRFSSASGGAGHDPQDAVASGGIYSTHLHGDEAMPAFSRSASGGSAAPLSLEVYSALNDFAHEDRMSAGLPGRCALSARECGRKRSAAQMGWQQREVARDEPPRIVSRFASTEAPIPSDARS